jgi:hypothetical protein
MSKRFAIVDIKLMGIFIMLNSAHITIEYLDIFMYIVGSGAFSMGYWLDFAESRKENKNETVRFN